MPSPPRVTLHLTQRDMWVLLQALRTVPYARPQQQSTVARLDSKFVALMAAEGWDPDANPFTPPPTPDA